MEFKGTKGPWSVINLNEDKGFPSVLFRGNEEQYVKNWGRTGVTINANGTQTEQDANALLISKAPEMLEMLQSILASEHLKGTIEESKVKQLIKEATRIK